MNILELIVGDRVLDQNNQLTIITSNLQAADIESRYGRRIRDRLREMAHTVVFANESYRR